MKLNKEECKNALIELFYDGDGYMRDGLTYEFDILEQLINEYFDNPPLKFEELQHEMVLWDNKKKEFIQLEFYLGWGYSVFGSEDFYTFNFEENRFYRREVKEDAN